MDATTELCDWKSVDATVIAQFGNPEPGVCNIYNFASHQRHEGHGRRALQELRGMFSCIRALCVGDEMKKNRNRQSLRLRVFVVFTACSTANMTSGDWFSDEVDQVKKGAGALNDAIHSPVDVAKNIVTAAVEDRAAVLSAADPARFRDIVKETSNLGAPGIRALGETLDTLDPQQISVAFEAVGGKFPDLVKAMKDKIKTGQALDKLDPKHIADALKVDPTAIKLIFGKHEELFSAWPCARRFGSRANCVSARWNRNSHRRSCQGHDQLCPVRPIARQPQASANSNAQTYVTHQLEVSRDLVETNLSEL